MLAELDGLEPGDLRAGRRRKFLEMGATSLVA
jgi:hypothetical protein